MRSFAPLILAALASSASAQSFGASAGQPVPTDLPSGRPSGVRTGSAAFPQGTGGFGPHGDHGAASGSGGFAMPSGQSELGAQHSGFPSRTGSDFPMPTGSRPFESGSLQSARNFARQFPSGGDFKSGVVPSGTGFGGPQPTGERPTGAIPSGFPSGGPGGAFASGSGGPRPSDVNAAFASGNGGPPTGARGSGMPSGPRPSGMPTGAMPSGNPPSMSGEPSIAARQAPTGIESGFGGERPTGAIPSGSRPSGDAFPSGFLPTGARPSGALPSGALPSGAFPSGARPSGDAFQSGNGENGARPSGMPSGAPPAMSGAPTDIVARQAPTGAESGFGGSKPTGAFPSGGFPSGGTFPTGGPGGAFPSGANPTGAFKSGAAFPSGGANFPGNNAAQSGLPTIPIPSGGLPLIPTGGMAAPSGGFPTTFQTQVRPTTSV